MPILEARALLESIAANVRRGRARAGLTQEAFAERTGFDIRFVQRVERGRVNMSIETLARLAAALDVRPAALLRNARLQAPRTGRPPARKH